MENRFVGPRGGHWWNVVTSSFASCIAVGLALPTPAQSIPTVGIYDDPAQANGIDFVALGSTLDPAQFTSDVAAAFDRDFGGVYQCEAIGNPFVVSYGITQTKFFSIVRGENTTLGVGASSSLGRSISGDAIWVSILPEMVFLLDGAVTGIPDERVVEFGLTILSRSGFGFDNPLGNVTATAQFSGGGTAISSRYISEGAGLGDTFFGFAAPDDQSLVSVTFASTDRYSLPFDDIGFITTVVPEPSVGLLAACGMCLFFGFRTINRRGINRRGRGAGTGRARRAGRSCARR
jgi:hypothetical protein